MNFTREQIQAVRRGVPVRVVLPEIGEECLVLRSADFEVVAHALEALDARQTCLAIDEEWKDDRESPELADYDQYEGQRK